MSDESDFRLYVASAFRRTFGGARLKPDTTSTELENASTGYFLVPTPVIMNWPSMTSKLTPSLPSTGVSVIFAAKACP